MPVPFTILLLVLGISLLPDLQGSPLDDLASQDQAVRDAAAKILRKSFVPAPRTTYKKLLAALPAGLSKAKTMEILAPYHPKSEGMIESGGERAEIYRLDGTWGLTCHFDTRADSLMQCQLSEWLEQIWVAPPPHFSGVWTTYFVDGHRSSEIHYRAGNYDGVFTSFHLNGSPAVVQHYDRTGCNGDDTGYYPDGKISYRARYENNRPVGTWMWYNEDGSIRSTQKHPDTRN